MKEITKSLGRGKLTLSCVCMAICQAKWDSSLKPTHSITEVI